MAKKTKSTKKTTKSKKPVNKTRTTARRTPIEHILHNKYGKKGTDVYHLIDGKKSSGAILRKSKLTKNKLFEMLNFMEQHGIIRLDKA